MNFFFKRPPLTATFFSDNSLFKDAWWFHRLYEENILRVSAFTDYDTTVILNNELTVHYHPGLKIAELPAFATWELDDIATTLINPELSYSYCLAGKTLVCDLQIN